MAARLITAEEFFPQLEQLGLEEKETVSLEDGQGTHTVFTHPPTGKSFICPGIRGLPDEPPMFTQWMVERILKNAQKLSEE